MLMSRMDIIYMQCTITKKQRSFWEKRINPAEQIFFHDKEETICFDA